MRNISASEAVTGGPRNIVVEIYDSCWQTTLSPIQFVPVAARFFKDSSAAGNLYNPVGGGGTPGNGGGGSRGGAQSAKKKPFIKLLRGGRGCVWVDVGLVEGLRDADGEGSIRVSFGDGMLDVRDGEGDGMLDSIGVGTLVSDAAGVLFP